jgi:UDP-N-acetylglucosamine 1-carboxyvinyltransferase
MGSGRYAAAQLQTPGCPYNRRVQQLVVTGGRPLHGEVAVLGAKNAVLKHLVATLMAPGTHRLDNVPDIVDVTLMGSVISHIGATCRFTGTTVEVDVPDELLPEAPIDLVRRMRASILVLGALLARCGEARVALPGGDDFGSRPIDMHLDGLKALGVEFELVHGELRARAPGGLRGAEVPLEFPSVGATENLLFAGVMATGTTIISNAAREPEIQDLAEFLGKMGAIIRGAGTSTIEVEGVPRLSPASHRAVPDRLEAGTYLVAGAITGGEVTVRECVPEHLRMEVRKLTEAGCEITTGKDWIRVRGPERPKPVDFATLPFPGFHTDMHPQMVALLAVASGTSVITENIYAARFRYVGELNRLGADVSLEGQHVIIRGVDELSGCPVDACDIRAGAALVLAGLIADGVTTVTDAQHIDRGYSSFDVHLRSLGADIVRETVDRV